MPASNTDRSVPAGRRPDADDREGSRRYVHRGAVTGRAVAFWSAIALPFASLVVLLAGTVTSTDLVVLAALATANVLALYFGHGYATETVEAVRDGAADVASDDATTDGDRTPDVSDDARAERAEPTATGGDD